MARFRAQPYATALFEALGSDVAAAEAALGELGRVAEAFAAVPDLQRSLVVPTVPQETKTAILEAVLSALDVSPPVRRFMAVVQQHYRTEHLPDMVATLRDLIDRKAGRARARVATAAPLDQAHRDRLVAAMEQLTGQRVVAEFDDRPELLAGFRLRIGSKVFDGSLTAQLDRLGRKTIIEQR